MRTLLILWLGPVSLLSIWYGLSYHDINLGTTIFSRQIHDLTFNLYGNMLGIPPADVPLMAAKAIAFDSLFIVAIIAYKMRKSWWPTVKSWFVSTPQLHSADQGTPAE